MHYLLTTQSQLLTTLGKEALEKILGKEENACNQLFLLFPKSFLPFPKQVSFFLVAFIFPSASSLNLDRSKILLFGKELNH